ncbi:DUF4262 domain-containing protein [Streptomyces goshikiensis]|uniref:DUF4262 domain-containing protein n=1 Tax=Streptomyces goshikiensis TaxID=1942 RepID=UPI0036A13E14
MQTIPNSLGQRAVEGQPLWRPAKSGTTPQVSPLVPGPVGYRWYKAFFGTAVGCYRKPPFAVLQVVWPHRDGAFH